MKIFTVKLFGILLVTLSALPCLADGLVIATVAGTGTAGFSGDAGPASEAQINRPAGIAVDQAGILYFADISNNRVRKIDLGGIIDTVAGTEISGYNGDGIPAEQAQLNSPHGLAFDASGNLFIADTFNHRIRKIDGSGKITTVAGNGIPGSNGDGAEALAAQLNEPRDLAFDAAGNLYIADFQNHKVRKVDTLGKISTVAGTGSPGGIGDDGEAINAELNSPRDVAVDDNDNIFIADFGNHQIRKVSTDGKISTIAGDGTPGNLGEGGPAILAQLYGPKGLDFDSSGNLLIADSGNDRIRMLDTAGNLLTVAGTGNPGFSGDNGPPKAAQLSGPADVAVDAWGSFYISDFKNERVRKVFDLSLTPGEDSTNSAEDTDTASGATGSAGCQFHSSVGGPNPSFLGALMVGLSILAGLRLTRTMASTAVRPSAKWNQAGSASARPANATPSASPGFGESGLPNWLSINILPMTNL